MNGVLRPRTVKIYHVFNEGWFFHAVDRKTGNKKIMDYNDFKTPSQNEFLVSPSGIVLNVKYPAKAITDVVGVNIFDTLGEYAIPTSRS